VDPAHSDSKTETETEHEDPKVSQGKRSLPSAFPYVTADSNTLEDQAAVKKTKKKKKKKKAKHIQAGHDGGLPE
jgi:hypothetical protein